MNDVRSKRAPAPKVWFRVEEVELSWLPVRESAFLLWVLAALVLVWIGVAAALGLL
jgi:hypothetical protein